MSSTVDRPSHNSPGERLVDLPVGTIVKRADTESDTRFMVFGSNSGKSLIRLDTFREVTRPDMHWDSLPFIRVSATLTLHGN